MHSGCTTYEAVFDYKGELSTHLQLKQGDLVRVHRKEAAGWWRGTVEDQTGWFPSNYVQPAPPGIVFFLQKSFCRLLYTVVSVTEKFEA